MSLKTKLVQFVKKKILGDLVKRKYLKGILTLSKLIANSVVM